MKKHSILKGLACIFVYLSTLSSSFATSAPPDCMHGNDNFKCVQYERNYDANTINFNIPYIHPILGQGVAINLRDIEVPSPSSRKQCEKDKGKEARDFVESQLKSAKLITVTNLSKSRGKLYGDITYDGNSLRDTLLSKKMASSEKIDWCN